jgi:hypothetical protein
LGLAVGGRLVNSHDVATETGERVSLHPGILQRLIATVLLVALPGIVIESAHRAEWYDVLVPAAFAAYGVFRVLARSARAITFEPRGVELQLRFRTVFIRGPVVEMNGGRRGTVVLHDLRTDRRYDLPQPAHSTRLIEVAERHGYLVARRPRLQAR